MANWFLTDLICLFIFVSKSGQLRGGGDFNDGNVTWLNVILHVRQSKTNIR